MQGMYSAYLTDTAAEEEGLWCPNFRGGIEVKLRSTASRKVRDAQEKIARRNIKYVRTGSAIPADVQVTNEVDLCAAIIVDWRGPGRSVVPGSRSRAPRRRCAPSAGSCESFGSR